MARSGRAISFLFCEELADILEGLELESITAGVEEEHGCLLTDLTLEANVRLDHELGAKRRQAFGEGFPLIPLQDDAEVRYGYVMSIYRVAMDTFLG
jgi:hypothetical protein